jgi:hypothetical protein
MGLLFEVFAKVALIDLKFCYDLENKMLRVKVIYAGFWRDLEPNMEVEHLFSFYSAIMVSIFQKVILMLKVKTMNHLWVMKVKPTCAKDIKILCLAQKKKKKKTNGRKHGQKVPNLYPSSKKLKIMNVLFPRLFEAICTDVICFHSFFFFSISQKMFETLMVCSYYNRKSK